MLSLVVLFFSMPKQVIFPKYVLFHIFQIIEIYNFPCDNYQRAMWQILFVRKPLVITRDLFGCKPISCNLALIHKTRSNRMLRFASRNGGQVEIIL